MNKGYNTRFSSHYSATSRILTRGDGTTPCAVLSRIMAKVVGIDANATRQHTIYDPTCGSGSLLLKANDAAPDGLSIYGQEKDVATFALARMNMAPVRQRLRRTSAAAAQAAGRRIR